MKRKVIKQGSGGFTIYLPKKWANSVQLKAGDEIELEENEYGLLLNVDKGISSSKEIELKVNMKDIRFLKYIVNSLFIEGYNKVTLFVDIANNEVHNIYNSLKSVTEFEITEAKDKSIVLELTAEPEQESMLKMLKQLFFIVKSDYDEVLSCVGKEKLDLMRFDINSDRAIKYASHYMRSMNTKKVKYDGMSWTLANILKWISIQLYYIAKNTQTEKLSLSKEQEKFIKDIKISLDTLYDGIYTNSIDKLHRAYSNYLSYENDNNKVVLSSDKAVLKAMPHFILIHNHIMQAIVSAIGMTVKE